VQLAKCFLCGATEAHLIKKGVRGDAKIDVVQCNSCGLVRLSEVMENVDQFYEESGMRDQIVESVIATRKTTRADDDRRYYFTEKMIENKSILDFGCGAGGYLMRAKDIAAQVIGVELENQMRAALQKEGIPCEPKIENCGRVDVITLFHVLEHLAEPVEYLQQFKNHLNQHGKIIIEVPNANDALLSLYKNMAFANFTYWKCHLYLYTAETLCLLAKKAGLKVSFVKYIQRYSLANHLYWLSKGMPGGHYEWGFLEERNLDQQYANMLAGLGISDTIIAEFSA